ncbi:MAG: hypothetical protein AAF141_14540, partial [Pseudomonadota bacterium]
ATQIARLPVPPSPSALKTLDLPGDKHGGRIGRTVAHLANGRLSGKIMPTQIGETAWGNLP